MDKETKSQVADLIEKFKNHAATVHSSLGKSVTNACLLVEREAKKSMKETMTWTMVGYGGHRGGHIHYPSIPGSPPAIDTGRLVQSITHRVENAFTPTGYVGTKVDYGKFLETGTSVMAPRPWLGPALEKNREKIKEMLGQSVEGKIVESESENTD